MPHPIPVSELEALIPYANEHQAERLRLVIAHSGVQSSASIAYSKAIGEEDRKTVRQARAEAMGAKAA